MKNEVKFEAVALRPVEKDTPNYVSASVVVPVIAMDDDDNTQNVIADSAFSHLAFDALYTLIEKVHPEWLDNEDIQVEVDIYVNEAKVEKHMGFMKMTSEHWSIEMED